ncbi:TPA: DUF5462 family protein [Photobacterium damselae]
MKVTSLFFVSVLLLNSYSAVSSTILSSKNINLGYINGSHVDEQKIEIKRVLDEPVLFSMEMSQLSKPVSYLNVNNSNIIKRNENEIIIEVKDESQYILVRLTLELLVDGSKVKIDGKSSGTNTSIAIPNNYRRIELRTTRPIIISFPKTYRGPFNFALDISGHSL